MQRLRSAGREMTSDVVVGSGTGDLDSCAQAGGGQTWSSLARKTVLIFLTLSDVIEADVGG